MSLLPSYCILCRSVRGASAAEHEASLRKLYTVKTVQVSRSVIFFSKPNQDVPKKIGNCFIQGGQQVTLSLYRYDISRTKYVRK